MTYTGSLQAPPIIIRQSQWKVALFLLGSLMFVVIGVFVVLDMGAKGETDVWKGWAAILFFGLCALVFAYALLRPATLVLTPHGFTYRLGRSRSVAWCDVAGFDIFVMRSRGLTTSKSVCWTYLPHYDKQKIGRQISAALSGGAEGSLPHLWPMKAEALHDLMEQARQRWSATSGQNVPGWEKQGSLIE